MSLPHPTAEPFPNPFRVAPRRFGKSSTGANVPAGPPKAPEPYFTYEPPAEHHKRPRTGAGARFNADHIALYRAVNAGVIITALAAIAISWQGLTAVGSWFLPIYAAWLLPIAVDVAIVVFTLATLSRRSRGESVGLLLLGAYGLTGVSAVANFGHVVLEPRPDLQPLQLGIAATLAGLAPLLILLTTEVLGTLITKPPRADRPSAKLAETQAELKKVRTELTKLKKAAAKTTTDKELS